MNPLYPPATLLDAPTRDPDWSIWPLAYCQADMPYDFFGGSGPFSNKGITRIPMIYTLLAGGEVGGKKRVALVDCGFKEPKWLKRYAFRDWEDPKTVLARAGFAPSDVEAILCTHMHFDHIGNFDAFPNAKLYVQLDEYVGWTQAVSFARQNGEKEETSWVFSSFDPDDLVRASKGVSDGRIVFLKGDCEVLPGITAHLAKNSHTFGTQWFEIQTRNGPYCVVGDTIYWYSNVEMGWVPGYNQGNAFFCIYTYDRIKKLLKGETSRIVPGHDAGVWERHPSWAPTGGNQVAELHLAEKERSRKQKGRPAGRSR